MTRYGAKYRDEDQRFFTDEEPDAQKARAFLGQKAEEEQRPLSRADRAANLSKLSELIGAAVDEASKNRS